VICGNEEAPAETLVWRHDGGDTAVINALKMELLNCVKSGRPKSVCKGRWRIMWRGPTAADDVVMRLHWNERGCG
jgi:hypothetical protein